METVRRELEPWLQGRTIARAAREEAPPGPKYQGLERAAGQSILEVRRRGKFLLLPLSAGDELVVHLGMTGSIHKRRPADHVRVRLELCGGVERELFFRDPRRFGRFLLVDAGDYAELPTLAAMGPEPLSQDFSAAGFRAALKRSAAPVKTYLLSQKPVAGVGNIYADEALWRAGIHPLTPARAVGGTRADRLRDAIREVLQASLEARGTTLSDYRTVEGESGGYSESLAAYGRAGEACARCGTSLERLVVAGRGTHFCPRCQRRR